MYNGFYCEYYENNQTMNNDEFLKMLDSVEDEINIDSENGSNFVSVASFLLGFCYHLASYFREKYGYKQELIVDREGYLVHSYCVFENAGHKYFIDSRGITDNRDLFFGLFEYAMDNSKILNISDLSDKKVFEEKNFIVFDEISDSMIEWLVNSFDYYNIHDVIRS